MDDGKKDADAIDDIFAMAFAGQAPGVGQRHVEIKTPSGRRFRYELSEYPISTGMTPEAALAQAKRIFREKYRYCEWDRNHPHVDVEQEIIAKIVGFILRQTEAIQRWEARKPRVFATWGIFLNGQLLEEFPYKERAAAEQRLRELAAQNNGRYELRQLRRTAKPLEAEPPPDSPDLRQT